jgi:hypothetical protein
MKYLASFLAASALAMMTGCAGETADAGAEDGDVSSGDDALSAATVGAGAVAVEIRHVAMLRTDKDSSVIVAGKKLARITRALKKRNGSAPIPACAMAFRQELHFLNAKGEETSNATIGCGGVGELVAGTKRLPLLVDGTVDTVAGEPLVPGDALWGITKVKVTRPGFTGGSKAVSDVDDVADLVEAIDPDQKIGPQGPTTRCAPDFVVTYSRGAKDAATASFTCGGGTGKVGAQFTITGGKPGTVQIDSKPVAAVFAP